MRRYACCICVVVLTAMGVAWAVQDATFTAESVVTITVVDGNPWAHHAAIVTGAGHASHVGDFTITLDVLAKGNGDSQGTGAIQTNSGDLLYVETESSWNAETGVRSGIFALTGGTGRFAGASGGGALEAVVVAGAIVMTMDGTISY